MANIILGTDLMLFKVENPESGSAATYSAIAAATNCKLTLNANTLETSSKDSGKWTSKRPAKLSWSCSTDHLFTISGYSDIMDSCIKREPIYIRVSTTNNDETIETDASTYKPYKDGYEGYVVITSVDMNAPDGDNASFSVSMDGVGELKACEHGENNPDK